VTGLRSYRRRVAACANPGDTEERYAWAKAHLNFNWRTISLFMDCKFFRMPLPHLLVRSQRVWRRAGEALQQWAAWVDKSSAPFKRNNKDMF